MCKHFGAVINIALRTVEGLERALEYMLVHFVRIVFIDTLVSRTLNNSKWAGEELVIVYLIDVKFFSAFEVCACDHNQIIHLGSKRARPLSSIVM